MYHLKYIAGQIRWNRMVIYHDGIESVKNTNKKTSKLRFSLLLTFPLLLVSKKMWKVWYLARVILLFSMDFFPTSWWFQPIRKTSSSNWIISLGRGEHKKHELPPPRNKWIHAQVVTHTCSKQIETQKNLLMVQKSGDHHLEFFKNLVHIGISTTKPLNWVILSTSHPNEKESWEFHLCCFLQPLSSFNATAVLTWNAEGGHLEDRDPWLGDVG